MAKRLSLLHKKRVFKIVDGFLTKVYNYFYNKNELIKFANYFINEGNDIKKFYI